MTVPKMPTGLQGAYSALANDSTNVREHITSLVWLRQLTDPTMPSVGGHDPRTVLETPLSWEELCGFDADLWAVLSERLNQVMGCGELLSMDWHELGGDSFKRAVHEISRWVPNEQADALGFVYQETTAESSKGHLGAFYTPYSVSLMMAKITAPEPGARVLDPCCGAGGMLLAALEACRDEHGHDNIPEVFGIDIDPGAVRVCRLNLALAGIAPWGRVDCRDALRMPFHAEDATPLRKLVEASGGMEQLELNL